LKIVMLVESIHVHCNCKIRLTSNPQIHVRFLRLRHLSFLKSSNSKIYSRFSGRCPITSLMYALILTNNSTIDLRIWKGHRFENNLKLNRDLR
jgi:hypothetical protein